ncbi:HK97 family phage prohead protease [Schleiferilactobacillus shenzhenensis]|nr:HK97 family phage prohead protease [Schleiferilactobacillus shenzhenensis]
MTATPLVLRDAETPDAPQVIEGYALKFNKPSEVMGFGVRFIETIDPHALDSTDLNDVVALFNHDQSQILGRTGVNLGLSVDNIGLKYRITPEDTNLWRDLTANIKAGIIKQSSFAFDLPDDDAAQEWAPSDSDEADYTRTIKAIAHIYDVSPVTRPAYPDTEVTVGSRGLVLLKAAQQPAAPPAWQSDRDKMIRELRRQQLLNKL